MTQQSPQEEEKLPSGLVAIVGRPNVGKSTLFNRLVGRRDAIVHDQPGVTRDRHYATAWALGRPFTLIDTGGFDPESDDPMKQGIVMHVGIAVDEADLIVCVLDATQGPTDGDRRAVQLLRKSGRPVIYVANKGESPSAKAQSAELYRLGLPELLVVSALHGTGFGALEQAINAGLPDRDPDADLDNVGAIRVALVGRPNAGKSSMLNRFAGQTRALVDSRPGTTRDPIHSRVERPEGTFLLVDTAGIRRQARVTNEHDTVEIVSVLQAMKAMEEAQVVVMMCDAAEGVAEQDAKILGLAVDRGRALVIALNKADLLTQQEQTQAKLKAREKLSFAPWAPIVFTSATNGRGTSSLLKKVREVHGSFTQRIPTGELNRFFEQVLATHPPPTQGGKAPRLKYITQAETCPPLFIVSTNSPEAIHFSYRRYVTNQLRERFGFEGAPLRIAYRNSSKKSTKDN